jgi:hypothetical protein
MCKYGDFFLKLEISEKFGVYNVIPYTAYHIERQEGYNLENPSEIRYRYAPDGLVNTNSGMYRVPGQSGTTIMVVFSLIIMKWLTLD